jgi:hypothetical protein
VPKPRHLLRQQAGEAVEELGAMTARVAVRRARLAEQGVRAAAVAVALAAAPLEPLARGDLRGQLLELGAEAELLEGVLCVEAKGDACSNCAPTVASASAHRTMCEATHSLGTPAPTRRGAHARRRAPGRGRTPGRQCRRRRWRRAVRRARCSVPWWTSVVGGMRVGKQERRQARPAEVSSV